MIYIKPIFLVLILFFAVGCSENTTLNFSNADSCGEYTVLDKSSESKKAANCFYESLEDCSENSMDYKIKIPLGTTTIYTFTIMGEKADNCIVLVEPKSTTRNITSGVFVIGNDNPHLGSSMQCPYTKTKSDRAKSNDFASAYYLLSRASTSAKEGKCTGTMVELLNADQTRTEAFEDALKKSSEESCNKIIEENYKEDCKKTIRAINEMDQELCESVDDIEMRLVCLLKMLKK